MTEPFRSRWMKYSQAPKNDSDISAISPQTDPSVTYGTAVSSPLKITHLPDGWTAVSLNPPPVNLADLERPLVEWPGDPRCAVAELERAGVPRDEAMAQIRAQYDH